MLTVTASGWSGDVAEGEVLRFGRGTPDDGVELTLSDDPRLHRQCGVLTVQDDGWTVFNTGGWLHLRLVDLDGLGRDDLPPGSRRRVPWIRTEVSVGLGTDRVGFSAEQRVLRPAGRAELPPEAGQLSGRLTIDPFALDRGTGYFRALVALCQPRLEDSRNREVPSDAQVAVRLNRVPSEVQHVTARGVGRRIAYLRSLFGLLEQDERGSSAGLERRGARAHLVDIALEAGVVTAADLRLLEVTPVCPTGSLGRRSDRSAGSGASLESDPGRSPRELRQ